MNDVMNEYFLFNKMWLQYPQEVEIWMSFSFPKTVAALSLCLSDARSFYCYGPQAKSNNRINGVL